MEETPELVQVLQELGPGFIRWHPLGLFLRVPLDELNAIKATEHDVLNRTIQMLERWYANKHPTWGTLCEALRKVGHSALADRISDQYCRVQQPTSAAPLSETRYQGGNELPHPPAPTEGSEGVPNDPQAGLPRIPGDEDPRMQVLDDEEKRDISVAFAVMFAIVVQSLSKKVDVDTLKTFLRSFRCHITTKPYVSPDLYNHCKMTSEVLLSLEPLLINATHPYLLRKIIENFGCEESRQAVREYDAKLPRTIALKNLGDPVPDWMIAACHGAKKIVVVVKGESDTITRGGVEDVQIALEGALEVERVFIVFAKHEERNSVGLTFLVPECVSVVSCLRHDGQKLMNLAANGITRIEVDGDTIEVDVEAKLWKHRMMGMEGKRSDELSVDSGVDSRGGSIVSSRRSSFSEDTQLSLREQTEMGSTLSLESGYLSDEGGIPPSASSRDHQLAMEFADNLRFNKTAPERDFTQATITDAAASAISDALKDNKSLRELVLNRCNISTTGLTSLASALSTNTSLKTLRLLSCKVCDSAVEVLAAALLQNKTLEKLDLNLYGPTRNTISAKGWSALARSLCENKSLKILHLWNNSISDEGVTSLADALRVNKTLEYLNLSLDDVTDTGAEQLAIAIEANDTLRNLGLYGSGHISEEIKHRMRDCAKRKGLRLYT